MNDEIERKLASAGWEVECWTPLEIRSTLGDGSFATGEAARIVYKNLVSETKTEDELLDDLINFGFPEGHSCNGDKTMGLFFLGVADMIYDDLVYKRGVNVHALEKIGALARIRCLKKAPIGLHQINWPTGE